MFRFNFEKTLQAVAVVLRTEPSRRMNYMRMLKLLYICDRQSLAEIGRPITGDKVVAMKHGPVLSHAYDLIKGEFFDDSCSKIWNQYLEIIDRFDIILKQGVKLGTDLLNKYEIEKIDEICEHYYFHEPWDIVDLTHGFPEWKKNYLRNSSKSNPIPFDDIIEAVNRSDDAEAIKKEAAFEKHLTAMFEG